MSKARLVITAVTVEKRPVGEVARSYGVARSWVYALLAPAAEDLTERDRTADGRIDRRAA
jgi:hypothetical protein